MSNGISRRTVWKLAGTTLGGMTLMRIVSTDTASEPGKATVGSDKGEHAV